MSLKFGYAIIAEWCGVPVHVVQALARVRSGERVEQDGRPFVRFNVAAFKEATRANFQAEQAALNAFLPRSPIERRALEMSPALRKRQAEAQESFSRWQNVIYADTANSTLRKTGLQKNEWEIVEAADELDFELSTKVTEWGVFLIPGSFLKHAGFSEAKTFRNAMAQGDRAQTSIFARLLQNPVFRPLRDALASEDYESVVRHLNGRNDVNEARRLFAESAQVKQELKHAS